MCYAIVDKRTTKMELSTTSCSTFWNVAMMAGVSHPNHGDTQLDMTADSRQPVTFQHLWRMTIRE